MIGVGWMPHIQKHPYIFIIASVLSHRRITITYPTQVCENGRHQDLLFILFLSSVEEHFLMRVMSLYK